MPLEKTQENLTTCQICKRRFKHIMASSVHITRTHKMSRKEYYDKYYKNINEDICLTCGKLTNFYKFRYPKHCSIKCVANNKICNEKKKQTSLNKYGHLYPSQNIDVKKRIKNTNIDRYGVEVPIQSIIIKNKGLKTNLKKYGHLYPSQNIDIKNKTKATNIEKYGVEYCQQNREIHEKGCKTRIQSKPYTLPSNKIVYKMGYEPQFLDYVFKNNILTEDEIDYSPKGIKYVDRDYNIKHYFPDFYIPKWNLIIEIKSDYIETLDINCYLKEIITRSIGFNYIKILNNKGKQLLNFNQFLILIGIIKNQTISSRMSQIVATMT